MICPTCSRPGLAVEHDTSCLRCGPVQDMEAARLRAADAYSSPDRSFVQKGRKK